MKLIITLLFISFSVQAADWRRISTGQITSAQQHDDYKSYGPEMDAFWVGESQKVLAKAQREGGSVCIKTWGRNIWVGRQIEGGAFQGPYLASGYYTSKIKTEYRSFQRP